MNFDGIKGIILDFDGTVADSMEIWGRLGISLLEKNNVKYPDSIIRDVTPLGAVGTAQYFKNLGLNMTVEEIIAYVAKNALYEYSNNIYLKNGAEKFLREQKAKGIRISILSASSEEAIIPCLKRLGADDIFEHIITCDKTGMLKSETKIYDYAANLMGLEKSKILYFDDNLGAIKASTAAGLKTVAVYDKSSLSDKEKIMKTADYYIHSFYELTDFKITVLDGKTLGDDIDMSPVTSLGNAKVYDLTPPELQGERTADCDVIVTNKLKMNEQTLKNAKNVSLICVTATGYDNVDTEYCKKRGIAVCNIKGYSTDSVALITVSTVLSLFIKLFSYRNFVMRGGYTKSGCPNSLTPVFHELKGKTWGIIGYGNIGRAAAKIAEAFGCKVIYSRNTPDENAKSVDYICTHSDIISIHTPLTDKTRNLINKERIEKMKDGVILVNEARGAVTDEKAVCGAVKSGKIGGFGSDVYTAEPFTENHPFWEIKDLENVCLTPHMAWGASEARQRCIDEVAKNITSFLQSEKRNRIV